MDVWVFLAWCRQLHVSSYIVSIPALTINTDWMTFYSNCATVTDYRFKQITERVHVSFLTVTIFYPSIPWPHMPMVRRSGLLARLLYPPARFLCPFSVCAEPWRTSFLKVVLDLAGNYFALGCTHPKTSTLKHRKLLFVHYRPLMWLLGFLFYSFALTLWII